MAIIIYIDSNIILYHAFAISSFSRDTFEEFYSPCDQFGYLNYPGEISMIDFNCLESTDLIEASNSPLPVDITDVSYFSNGEIFNATLWLNSPLYDNQYADYVEANLSFFMFIYNIDRSGNEVSLKITNTIYIYPEQDGNWTYKFFENHPYDGTEERLIESNHNYNNLYQNGKKFVHIPLDLNSIGNPEEFAVQFQMSAETDYSGLNFLKDKGKELLIDLTNWDTIPPGDY